MKRISILGISAVAFFFTACGGESHEEETHNDEMEMAHEEEVVETMVKNYMVDTSMTVINWNNYEAGEVGHQGTVKALNGSVEVSTTGDVVEITGADLTIDMNTISEGSEKLEGHLMSPDFFDVNTYASTAFTFDRHEEGTIYGSVNIIGHDVAVEAPATVTCDESGVTVEVGEFKVDFSETKMPFFVAEMDAPEEEKHDPMIAFTATIKAKEGMMDDHAMDHDMAEGEMEKEMEH